MNSKNSPKKCRSCKKSFRPKSNQVNCKYCIEMKKQSALNRQCRSESCNNTPAKGKHYCNECRISDFWQSSFGIWLYDQVLKRSYFEEQFSKGDWWLTGFYELYREKVDIECHYIGLDPDKSNDEDLQLYAEYLNSNTVKDRKAKIYQSIFTKLKVLKVISDLHTCHFQPIKQNPFMIADNFFLARSSVNQKSSDKIYNVGLISDGKTPLPTTAKEKKAWLVERWSLTRWLKFQFEMKGRTFKKNKASSLIPYKPKRANSSSKQQDEFIVNTQLNRLGLFRWGNYSQKGILTGAYEIKAHTLAPAHNIVNINCEKEPPFDQAIIDSVKK